MTRCYWSGLWLACCLLQAGCAPATAKRVLSTTFVPAATEAEAVMPKSLLSGPVTSVTSVRHVPVSLDCASAGQSEQSMLRSVIAELMARDEYYAALAQVELLPRNAAESALLRADILSRLDPASARPWYDALLSTCLRGRAEHGLARLDAAEGNVTLAIERLQRAVSQYPVDPVMRHDLGVLWMQRGVLDKAYFELRTAEQLAKDSLQPRFSLMLLALLDPSSQPWVDAVRRWQPDRQTRSLLQQQCQLLVSQGFQRVGHGCRRAVSGDES